MQYNIFNNLRWDFTGLEKSQVNSQFILSMRQIQALKPFLSEIIVTSQTRTGDYDKKFNSPHYRGLAVDCIIIPTSLTPFVWEKLHELNPKANVYMNIENGSLHFDIDDVYHTGYKRLETAQTSIDMSVPEISSKNGPDLDKMFPGWSKYISIDVLTGKKKSDSDITSVFDILVYAFYYISGIITTKNTE